MTTPPDRNPPLLPPPHLSFSFQDILATMKTPPTRTTSDTAAMTMPTTPLSSSSRDKAPATTLHAGPTSGQEVQNPGGWDQDFVRGSKRGTRHHQPATATATQWTPALTRHFLEAIVNEFGANGRETGGWYHSAWISVQDAIWDITGEFVDKQELVEKYKILKSEWRAWVLIKEDKSVIGTGYNPMTGLVEGPGYWWDKMIARNPKVAKFRDNSLEHEELMGLVYEKVTATGSEANSAGDSGSDHDIAKGFEESDEMNSDGTGPATKNTFVPLLCKGKVQYDPNLLTLGGLSSKKRKAPESSELSASLAHQPQPRYSRTPDTWRWTDSDPTQTAGQYAPYEVGSSYWNSGPISHVTTRVTNPIHTEEKSSSDSEIEVDDEICAQVIMEQELELISSLLQVAKTYIPRKPQRIPNHMGP